VVGLGTPVWRDKDGNLDQARLSTFLLLTLVGISAVWLGLPWFPTLLFWLAALSVLEWQRAEPSKKWNYAFATVASVLAAIEAAQLFPSRLRFWLSVLVLLVLLRNLYGSVPSVRIHLGSYLRRRGHLLHSRR
jgi:hypothetical protein